MHYMFSRAHSAKIKNSLISNNVVVIILSYKHLRKQNHILPMPKPTNTVVDYKYVRFITYYWISLFSLINALN